jgi:hypothetical protein
MSYTETDVRDYLTNVFIIKKTRKRNYLDNRNYLLALMFYKFNLTEDELGFIFKIDRSTINISKKIPYFLFLLQDGTFIKNTTEVQKLFPFTFPEPNIKSKLKQRSKVMLSLDQMLYGQVKMYADKNDMYMHTAIRELIKKGLEWEE